MVQAEASVPLKYINICVHEYITNDYSFLFSLLFPVLLDHFGVETSLGLYREFSRVPWVPWKSHRNGKYYSSCVGIGKSMGMA